MQVPENTFCYITTRDKRMKVQHYKLSTKGIAYSHVSKSMVALK